MQETWNTSEHLGHVYMYNIFKLMLLLFSLILAVESMGATIDNKVLRLQHLSGCRLKISSGYRTPKRNKAIGGAPESYHLSDRARDLIIVGKCPHNYRTLALIAAGLFGGVISYRTHLHVDTREEKFHKHRIDGEFVDIK